MCETRQLPRIRVFVTMVDVTHAHQLSRVFSRSRITRSEAMVHFVCVRKISKVLVRSRIAVSNVIMLYGARLSILKVVMRLVSFSRQLCTSSIILRLGIWLRAATYWCRRLGVAATRGLAVRLRPLSRRNGRDECPHHLYPRIRLS